MDSPPVKILKTEVLSDNWYVLRKVTYEMVLKDGTTSVQSREAYDRGNGATILLYDRTRRTVVLTRQFRLPTYVNGNGSGMLIEACAGLLDKHEPAECVRREAEEETGLIVRDVQKILQVYMSPGSVTELVHFFIAEYSSQTERGAGGGVAHEGEHIEVLEIPFDDALGMVDRGEICDGKTIILLQYAKLHGVL